MCVWDKSIAKYSSSTVSECKNLCNQRPDCLAFEFGVDYGGSTNKPNDCLLHSGMNTGGCYGPQWNVELYIKIKKTTQGT